ncbi:ATP-binding protein [Noviherbaspirillum galbum]|uniref:histidine kinase n=1 Tax=Noviherbaspirillum galbum TaxID=2709383 RepID=A0A6B3SXE3_9BURK|nr:ATP-binding protein [Noviherbaspirillum galbum]NEX63162.1 GAF domain-containing protein [Noviherbaspirillum galbum]
MAVTDPQPELDLSRCDSEPIRIPGSVQQHGFLVALHDDADKIAQASANIGELTGTALDAEALSGRPLSEAIGDHASRLVHAELARLAIGQQVIYLCTTSIGESDCFDVLAHRNDGLLILDFEQVPRKSADFRLLYTFISRFLSRLSDKDDVEDLSRHAIEEIKDLTRFGRVMVYRFDSDGHGHVLAESCDPGYATYLNHRFPASDVPRQARELYLHNRIRLIPDAHYQPSRLVPGLNPLSGAPTDLTYSTLRSVSPIHLQYMRNMGTPASMSVSLIVKGKLWGLISCHHAEPRFVSFETRAACEHLAQVLALRIESREDVDEYDIRLDLRRSLVGLLSKLSRGPNFIESVRAVEPELLRFAGATGAALLFDDRLELFGDTPPQEDVAKMIEWIGANSHGDSFHTDSFGKLCPDAALHARNASGLLAIPLSRLHRHYLVWFRPETVQTIDWAGNPHLKVMQAGFAGQLTPRKSFETWHEEVRGCSLPWRASDVETALELRSALLEIVLERAEAVAALAEELTRANKELEAFSYSVSHDLRAPMRHIVGYADLLLETSEVDGKDARFLRNIKDSARFAGKLVDDLLSFSQMGRASLHPARVDMKDLVNSCINRLAMDAGTRRIDWRIGELPDITADPTFLQLAVYNLLSNAVKYTGPREVAEISVSAEDHAEEVVYCVKDNGVGFNADYTHKLFGVFQRLHRMEDFQGTGIGLANVRRIIERHGGRVWAEGAVQQGARFYFALPKQPQFA